MDVVVIFNGIGNQMSQYSFYLKKKSISKSTYLMIFCNEHNGYELNKVFNIQYDEPFFSKMLHLLFRILLTEKMPIIFKPLKLLLKLFNFKIIKENFNYNFNSDYLLKSSGIIFYFGGWHSEKYFLSVKDSIMHDFNFNVPADCENVSLVNKICSTNSISIHVRRGDYLSLDNLNLFGEICTKKYFEKAMDFITHKVPEPHFFVFSNDMTWVKANLVNPNISYISYNNGFDSWKDMYLMSLCKHNIISNSTFSWWAAWLNKNNEKIVVTPKRFLKNNEFSDVYPDSWIKLKDY